MKYFFTLLMCIIANVAFAQEENDVNFWEAMKIIAKERPDYIKEKAALLLANAPDSVFEEHDEQIAYFGYSYLSDGEDWGPVSEAARYYHDQEYAKAIAEAKKTLEINPLNIRAYNIMAYSISAALSEKQNIGYTMEDGQRFYDRMFYCLNAIAGTGDGSKEHPFYVTSVSDEYDLVRLFFKISDIKSQSLLSDGRMMDRLELGETSEYYDKKEIYFDITRVLELERNMFKK